MKGKTHERISVYFLILILLGLLYIRVQFSDVDTTRALEGFGFWFLLVTFVTGLDADTHSLCSERLGIFKYIFLPLKHRGITHNPLLWIGICIVFRHYGFFAEGLGAACAAFLHMACDLIGTEYKKASLF